MELACTVPRVVVAAPQGRTGKTTITLGLIAALTRAGLCVQPFKKGPDFIDPSWHAMVAGRPCRNLDGFMMERQTIAYSFCRHSEGADIAVVEGAMGLYDGVDLEGSGSTAEIAKIISAPVLLIVDATRMTRSVAAMVMGFMHFDPGVNIAGVILNKVARPRHEHMLTAAIEKYCGIPVVGSIPKNEKMTIPDRHLGLIPAGEKEELNDALYAIGEIVAQHINLDKVISIARAAEPLTEKVLAKVLFTKGYGTEGKQKEERKAVIGIIWDKAFSFYYPENLEDLQAHGARLVYIDALHDRCLPSLDALYIGGGFPEVFAGELEANYTLRQDIKKKIEEGLPVYAECGGLMYLARRLWWQDRVYEMVGALPFDVLMARKPQGHGYVEFEVIERNPFLSCGRKVRGHEFHHSRVINLEMVSDLKFVYRLHRGYGINGQFDGLSYKNVLAAYTHIHAYGVEDWAANFVRSARRAQE